MAGRYTRDLLVQAAAESTSWDEAVRRCGGTPTPGTRQYLRARMAAEGIDTTGLTADRPGLRHSEESLRALVPQCSSIAEVVRRLGISSTGGNQAHIGRRVAALGVDTSHFRRPPAAQGKRTGREPVLALRDPVRGRVPGERLRRHLLASGLPEICAMCGTGPAWQGDRLRLEVDHIDGNWWDNRASNLRLLCPNCHAVTDTYRGRRRGPR